MQLVQPSKFFSVTIFYRQYWHTRVRTWAMLLFSVTLKNFDVCTVTMGVACPLLRRSIYALDGGEYVKRKKGIPDIGEVLG